MSNLSVVHVWWMARWVQIPHQSHITIFRYILRVFIVRSYRQMNLCAKQLLPNLYVYIFLHKSTRFTWHYVQDGSNIKQLVGKYVSTKPCRRHVKGLTKVNTISTLVYLYQKNELRLIRALEPWKNWLLDFSESKFPTRWYFKSTTHTVMLGEPQQHPISRGEGSYHRTRVNFGGQLRWSRWSIL